MTFVLLLSTGRSKALRDDLQDVSWTAAEAAANVTRMLVSSAKTYRKWHMKGIQKRQVPECLNLGFVPLDSTVMAGSERYLAWRRSLRCGQFHSFCSWMGHLKLKTCFAAMRVFCLYSRFSWTRSSTTVNVWVWPTGGYVRLLEAFDALPLWVKQDS